MKRQVFKMLILSAAAFAATHNCMAQAQTAPQNPAPQSKPAAPPQPHDHSHMVKTTKESSPAANYFTDVQLINQDGKPVRFYSDVLKGKTVVVNAFFTTCTSVCPPMNRNMEKIQEVLGDRVGRDVFLVSISVDPLTDTPPRLKEYAQRFHARPGWTFLTGKKENVDWALYKLGQYVENKGDHKTIWLIGNETTGLWKKALGLAKSDELMRLVNEVADDK